VVQVRGDTLGHVPTVILVRHGRSQANADGVLAGRTPGVGLDDTGREQAQHLAARLGEASLARVVTSPLERCRQTAELLSTEPIVDDRLIECDYGDWTGRKLSELRDEALWDRIQRQPSHVRFPGGESMRALQMRALDAIDDHDAAVAQEFGHNGAWVAVTHADIIKSIVADALGLHLDGFQRILVDPGSVSVVHFGTHGAHLWKLNVSAPADIAAATQHAEPDIAVGGGAGTT
jgi:probable phosphomutase (TIGR03848 family)